jgi:hypothetical protein
MRLSRKPQVKEDAFWYLHERAAELVSELRSAYEAETNHGSRCWLLELLGEARDPALEDLFAAALDEPDESLQQWAARGLRNLDTKTARTILWHHSQNRTDGT